MRRRILGILSLAILMAGCSEEPPPPEPVVRPVRAIQVGNIEELAGTYLPGLARAANEVDLSFRVSGPLVERPVNVGDEVRAGELVARIDPRDFEIERRNAQGRLDSGRAELTRTQADLDRLLNIYAQDPGATSKAAIDKARENRDRARASITSLTASVNAAEDRLRYTSLAAPFDGTIVTTFVENFQTVREKEPIVRILDIERIKVDVDVPERYITIVNQVTNLRVSFDAFPGQEVPAEIFEIGTEASTTTRTYKVTLILDQPGDIRILAGMAARVTADEPKPGEAGANEFVIPVSAVFSPDKGETSYVWIIDDATREVRRHEIVARRLTDAGIVVEEGLEGGEWIATAGVHFLNEGQKVRILDQQGS